MIYSNKELSQLLVESCVVNSIEHVVISPGSRNAPLIIGFTNHPKIKTYSIVDERCAAFFALGIAQQTQKPTAIVCTSGSALLNYYPAIAEAFYSDIPLLVISADRPEHLIDIGDGQTIRQENVFKNHSLYNANLKEGKKFFQENMNHVSKAIQTAILEKGPIHINVPFDEPLYETTDRLSIEGSYSIENQKRTIAIDYNKFASLWNVAKKKIILIGSHYPDKELEQVLAELVKDDSVLIFTETTSNVYHSKFINCIDKLIFPLNTNEFKKLQPELLVSLGGMVVSKKIKQFLRKFQPQEHWHIDTKKAYDTYHCLTEHVNTSATRFFNDFIELINPVESEYQKYWLAVRKKRKKRHQQFLEDATFSDLKVFDAILSSIPDHSHLQLGNSSVIRYTQLFNLNNTLNVFCNRGTSGIDGSTSTAIGASYTINNQTVFITGDISFFYDSNALWNSYLKKDFRIILINNGGGNIFKFIPGPNTTNAVAYFETPHHFTAKQLCEMYTIEYIAVENENELKSTLEVFYDVKNKVKLLEIKTSNMNNDTILRAYFDSLTTDY